MTTPKGSDFQKETMAEERSAMDELKMLDQRIAAFYGETIRAHTMAAAGIISGPDLEARIAAIKEKGLTIAGQLQAFALRIEHSLGATEEHLIGHLPEKEELHGTK